MQSPIKWYGSKQADKDTGKGQKRNAKSVAEEEGGRGVATRIKQPHRKREKSGTRPLSLGNGQHPNLGRL